MNPFSTYFELGVRHILDFDGMDHMLFLLALVCVYQVSELKRILILVTAFTVGHSITLALATTGTVTVNAAWIEFLIPLTIFLTAAYNIARGKPAGKAGMAWPYTAAVFFGLIHGFGFSNYLKMLLEGRDDVFLPLLAFNLGIETGQVLIVVIILILTMLLFQWFRFKHRDWILVLSGACAGAALLLLKGAVFW